MNKRIKTIMKRAQEQEAKILSLLHDGDYINLEAMVPEIILHDSSIKMIMLDTCRPRVVSENFTTLYNILKNIFRTEIFLLLSYNYRVKIEHVPERYYDDEDRTDMNKLLNDLYKAGWDFTPAEPRIMFPGELVPSRELKMIIKLKKEEYTNE